MRDERNRIDPIGQGAHILAIGALGELLGLECIKHVADEDRHSRSRKHAAINDRRREAKNELAQRFDEQELDEIIERQPEKTVNVSANDP